MKRNKVKDMAEEIIKDNERTVIGTLNAEHVNKKKRMLLEAYLKNRFNHLTKK